MNLENKVALVTGAGRGIGRTIAEKLAAEGCSVVLVSRTQKELQIVAESIQARGGSAIALSADLGSISEIRRVMETVRREYGTLHVLVNNAAVLRATPFMEIQEEEWDSTLAINLKAPFFLSQEAIGMMERHREGYIINISSTAALEVPAALASYGTSKMALAALSQALYQVGKERGVKVSVIYPGMTDTRMLRDFNPPVEPDKWMRPDDISDIVIFLLRQSDRVVLRELTPWATRHDQI